MPEPSSHAVQAYSIDDTVRRLLHSISRTDDMFAGVEYLCDFSRREALAKLQATLTEQGITHQHVILPSRASPPEFMQLLDGHLRDCQSGVISIEGFSLARPEEEMKQFFRQISVLREYWANRTLWQIWWMPHIFYRESLMIMPDFISWLSPCLHLQEILPAKPEDVPQELRDFRWQPEGFSASNSLKVESVFQKLKQLSGVSLIRELSVFISILYMQRQYEEVERVIDVYQEEILNFPPENKLYIMIASILDIAAKCKFAQKKYGLAEGFFLKSLIIFRERKNVERRDVLESLSSLYIEQKQYDKALLYLEEAAFDLKDLPQSYRRQPLIQKLALVYEAEGKKAEAELLLHQQKIYQGEEKW